MCFQTDILPCWQNDAPRAAAPETGASDAVGFVAIGAFFFTTKILKRVETDQRKDLKLHILSKKGSMKPTLALSLFGVCVRDTHPFCFIDAHLRSDLSLRRERGE